MSATNKRIIELPTASSIQSGDYIPTDSVANGTKKYEVAKIFDKMDADFNTVVAEMQFSDSSETHPYVKGDIVWRETSGVKKIYRAKASYPSGVSSFDATQWDEFDTLADVIEDVDFNADNVDYDNTTSGLTATNVQDAIDELESEKADISSLATVATSGSYNDLSDKPTIPDSADDISYDNTTSGLTADNVEGAIDEVVTEIDSLEDEKANKDGFYNELFAGNLISDTTESDTAPYLYRQSSSGKSAVDVSLVGGTVAWNQLVQNGNFADSTGWTTTYGYVAVSNNVLTFTVTNSGSQLTGNVLGTIQNHKYIVGANIRYNTVAPTGSAGVFIGSGGYDGVMFPISSFSIGSWTNCISVFNRATTNGDDKFKIYFRNTSASQTIDVKNCMLIDLTQAFGSTIADYVYSLEQATAGSGIAWLKSYGYLTKDYYAYQSGKLESVNVASRKVYDSNDTLLTTYNFDATKVLRGIPKLSNGQMYYDGDVMTSDGTVTRKRTQLTNQSGAIGDTITLTGFDTTKTLADIISDVGYGDSFATLSGNVLTLTKALTNATIEYPLATPTTESATPFTNPQLVGSTEEFVDAQTSASTPTRDVMIPCGQDSKYYIDLKAKLEELAKIPDVSSTNGTYTLKATRSASGVTYSWVSD